MSDHNAEQANNEENLRTNKSTLVANNSGNSSNDLEAGKISNGINTNKELLMNMLTLHRIQM